MTFPNREPLKGFSKGVKIAAKARATVKGVLTCEGCDQPIPPGTHRVDHKIARGLYGSGLLENAQVLGPCCWAEKDAADNLVVKRCKRIEAKHHGFAPPKRVTIQSRGFSPPREKGSPCAPTSKTIPRRNGQSSGKPA